MNEKIWWYLSRSSGVVAWLILAAAMVWGLLLSTRLLQDRRRPAWLLDLHRWLGALSVIFTALHLVGLWLDSYVEFGWRELFVPFASEWQPEAVAWGIVGLYVLAAIQLTSLVMRHLPRKLWKFIHMTSFVLFWVASIHAAQAGTDTGEPWYRISSIVIITAVLFTAAYRALAGSTRRRVQKRDPRPARAA